MTDRSRKNSETYWFAEQDPKIVVQQLMPDVANGGQDKSSAFQQIWQRNYLVYYSAIIKPENWDTGLNFAGNQGELIEMLVPLARSLTRQLVSIVTKQKLAFSVLADNTESGTIQTARLGTSLTKDIITRQRLDVTYENMVEHGLLTGMSTLAWQWRTDKGEFYTKDMQGNDHFKGDLEITAPAIWDIDFDPNILDPNEWQWVQIKKIHNRWDLIAQFPHLADELKKIPSVRESPSDFMMDYAFSPSEDDNVYVWSAYHKKTPSMPNGRMVAYCSDKCILMDGDNIYGRLPISVSRAEPIPGSGYGYPYFSNLLGVQEMMDNTISSIATNNSTFGVQAIAADRAARVDVSQIFGMNFFQYTSVDGKSGKPEPMQFTASAPEAWRFIDLLKSMMLDLSMINSALRGDPPSGVTSGTAIATLTTTALESVASSSKSARQCLRDCMMGSIDAYKRMANVDREMSISGQGGQTYSKGFKGSDLDGIKGVELVEMNPLMQTQMGRETQAEKLLQFGLITNVKGYFSVIEGAPTSEMYENELSQEDLVKRENEALIGGGQVLVVNIDDHPYHVMMHSMLLNDPKVRTDSKMTQAVLAHIAQHYQEETQIDPAFAAMVRTGKTPQGMPLGAPPPGAPPSAGGGPPPQDPNQPPPAAVPADQSPDGKMANPAQPAKDLLGRSGGPDKEVA